MVQYANGQLGIAVKDSGGNAKSRSATADYTIWDNAAAPRVVYSDPIFGTAQGTSDDQIITSPSDLWANGSMGELLDVEITHSAAATTLVTASHVVRINVADIWLDTSAGRTRVADKTLFIGDRYTKDTSGTESGPTGWKDNTINVAFIPSPVVRFRPAKGHVYAPRGVQYALLDGT